MAHLELLKTPIPGLILIQRSPIEDERGFFSRFYCANELMAAGVHKPIQQINHTLTLKRGAVRGMHFQHPPHAEIKVVTCLRGEIFDVAIDLRKGSPTFLQWHGEVLSAKNHRSMLIPQGFAHGFQTLTEDCELLYLHTAAYAREAEAAIHAADPALGIEWPLDITEMSSRDQAHPMIQKNFEGIDV